MNRPESESKSLTAARNLRLWVLFAALVAVMQVTDPLADAGLRDALTFWISRLLGVAGSLVVAEWFVLSVLADHWKSPAWLKPALLMPVIAVLPMTIVEVSVEAVVPQTAAYDDSSFREISPWLAAFGEYLTILSIVLPINVLLWVFIDQRRIVEAGPATPPEALTEPAFLAKAPSLDIRDVIALSSEEHYVRVWTAEGSELVYGRLGDAIAEMPDSLGMQVHRSWWVADAGVVRSKRGERRYRLELVNGTLVPVSDRFTKQVRARGLLNRRNQPNQSL